MRLHPFSWHHRHLRFQIPLLIQILAIIECAFGMPHQTQSSKPVEKTNSHAQHTHTHTRTRVCVCANICIKTIQQSTNQHIPSFVSHHAPFRSDHSTGRRRHPRAGRPRWLPGAPFVEAVPPMLATSLLVGPPPMLRRCHRPLQLPTRTATGTGTGTGTDVSGVSPIAMLGRPARTLLQRKLPCAASPVAAASVAAASGTAAVWWLFGCGCSRRW